MVRARGTRIGGKIYGVERGCQGREGLSKCKDSNAFTVTSARLCKLCPSRTSERRLSSVRRHRHAGYYGESVVFGNSKRRNVLQRLLASVALRLRGAYLFEVDRRPVLESARP